MISFIIVSSANYFGTISNTLLAYDLSNSVKVSGSSYVGGIIGRASTTSGDSKLIDPVSTGKVTGSGDHVDKYIGEATNVTIEE